MKDIVEDGSKSVGTWARRSGVAYESGTPFFTLNSGLHRLNDTSRKQTTGRTKAGVDAREGTGAEATGIGQRVGRPGNSFEKGG
ncbi:hypothetical protein KIW84_055456 [Lathyrus oleraceus]|uniref:Uncharacterized protein n=1 Tax=Pisum sativum TaxID=3888 RepID=A0A9D4X0C5_PEA|nr:hypothetical protein KIW84_055456 [Pisum sativum]